MWVEEHEFLSIREQDISYIKELPGIEVHMSLSWTERE